MVVPYQPTGDAKKKATSALIVQGKPKPITQEVTPKTTLKDFAPRFLDGYARANRQKPSGIAAKETILRVHTVLNTLLKTAVAWDVLDRMPCTVRLASSSQPLQQRKVSGNECLFLRA